MSPKKGVGKVNIFSRFWGFARRVRDNYRLVNEKGTLFRGLENIVRKYETNPHIQKENLDRLDKAFNLILLDASDKIDNRETTVNREIKEHLLVQLGVSSTEEAVLKVSGHVNAYYNPCLTEEEKWISLEVKLAQFSYEKEKCLKTLKNEEEREKLNKEEELLREKVDKFKPGQSWYQGMAIFQEEWFKACDLLEMNLRKLVSLARKGLSEERELVELVESAQKLRSNRRSRAINRNEVCLRR